MKVTYEFLIMDAILFSLDSTEGITYQKFRQESNARYVLMEIIV